MDTATENDSEEPTPFVVTLQKLALYAQKVLDTPLDDVENISINFSKLLLDIQNLGKQWEIHREWACRQWYIRLLLAAAALNRALEWWEAERKFWASTAAPGSVISENDIDQESSFSTVPDDSDNNPETLSTLSKHLGSMYLKENLSSADERSSNQPSPVAQSLKSLDDEEPTNHSALKQSYTVIMDLSLQETIIQYVSPVWLDLLG